ncbi:MAG: DUF3320 domain-containing protein [Caulobacteraceae bacterium]|nr:DUF3320 domain-containing protein [Caulobacteraceae bacterium]
MKVEQPIHQDEVGRRLARVCGHQRAGSQIQRAAQRGLRFGKSAGRLAEHRQFWTQATLGEIAPRDRGSLAQAEMVRKPEMICGRELAAAARMVLTRNLALAREELVVETARLIGLARVGEYVREAIEAAIDQHLAGEVAQDHLGRLKLKQP